MIKFVKSLAFAGVLMAGLIGICAKADPVLTTLATFAVTNGASPIGQLVQASDGNFYGTTAAGGVYGRGTLFQMTPAGTLTNLVSFDETNGSDPKGGLTLGTNGDFYGTTYSGGDENFGTIFKLTAFGAFTNLFSFDFNNGGYLLAGLDLGQDGNFYGAAAIGGSNSAGTIFRFHTNGTVDTLFSFSLGTTNGDSPYANLVQTKDGSFYGSTYQGGADNNGTLFRIATDGTFETLHLFTGIPDGSNPYAGLIQANDGVLYGTTYSGGAENFGTIFKLTTNGVFSTLFSFSDTNGANPQAALIQAGDGSFYGTTANGGIYTNQFGTGYGTIFKWTTNGVFSTLLSFNNTNGANPQAALILGTDASLYGTTANGGANGSGTVFRLEITSPPRPVFQSIVRTGNSITFAWSSLTGYSYQIQCQTNLAQNEWSNLGNVMLATNITSSSVDDIGLERQKFYRAVLLR
ncbi:MAG TPA: choice-of-anchor tandem repeat GloVer-containing protein [Verrucomicrobiae bacterium]